MGSCFWIDIFSLYKDNTLSLLCLLAIIDNGRDGRWNREVREFLKMSSDGGGIGTFFGGLFGLPKPSTVSRPPEILNEILGLVWKRHPAGFCSSDGDFNRVPSSIG
ncbi:hypothetical protein NL676_019042 [Syzygium grande]|nr:hypothetical protein NL676_019042 [Syzygium grande]